MHINVRFSDLSFSSGRPPHLELRPMASEEPFPQSAVKQLQEMEVIRRPVARSTGTGETQIPL